MSDHGAPSAGAEAVRAIFHRSPRRTYPVVERGEGIHLYDTAGKRYIDACGGALVVSIGYGVAEVIDAWERQARRTAFAHGSQFSSAAAQELAGRIADMTPGDLNRVYLVSGGSEATETAVKLARQYHVEAGRPDKYKIVSRWGSYHGATLGALALSGVKGRRALYEPLLKETPHIEPVFCYRCPFDRTYPDCALACADELERTIRAEGPQTVAAFIAEPVVGAALGAVVPPDGYFERVRAICDQYDVLWIADEVMSGVGRTGRNFGVDHWGLVPDMIVMAKGLASGYAPMGAVAVREGIFEAIRSGSGTFVHGHTYGQHVAACAAAAAVLAYIERHRLVQRVAELGPVALRKLETLRSLASVGDVRGRGLMLGVEFVADAATRAPYPPQAGFARRVAQEAFERGLVVYPGSGTAEDGRAGDHLLLGPHFITTEAQLDEIVSRLGECIAHTERHAGG